MKRLTATILACGLLASGVYQAAATPVMRLSADGGLTWTNIVDNGPADTEPTAGMITFQGTLQNWVVNVATGIGADNQVTPVLDLGTVNLSVTPATLIVQMSETGFIPFPNETFIAVLGTSTPGTVTYNTYRDTGNVLFGTTSSYPADPLGVSPSPTAASLISQGPVSGSGFIIASNSVVVPNGGNTPYSLTLETIIVHSGGGQTFTDGSLFPLQPPPCNCQLTFNSPSSITNCVGDTIPAVTASQDCGNGPVSVPVTFAGAVTNGVCPKVITRTNTATDNCGNLHTFVQTITINCKPDCTLTASVPVATLGTGGLTASIADAGPGANYFWTINNGSITNGQGTRTITWVAGTDTTKPVTICVSVSTGAGCISQCCLTVPLTPPPGLGGGDTATIGFWHNKNGQGIILGASNSPALGNWLGTNFPCMFGNLTGKSNSVVAAQFMTYFGVSGKKTQAQVMAGALAAYFTSSNLGGNGNSSKFGFNISPGGTGGKSYNVGSLGTVIGLQNNTSYTVFQILQAANSKCPFSSDVYNALNDIFDGINQKGDI